MASIEVKEHKCESKARMISQTKELIEATRAEDDTRLRLPLGLLVQNHPAFGGSHNEKVYVLYNEEFIFLNIHGATDELVIIGRCPFCGVDPR